MLAESCDTHDVVGSAQSPYYVVCALTSATPPSCKIHISFFSYHHQCTPPYFLPHLPEVCICTRKCCFACRTAYDKQPQKLLFVIRILLVSSYSWQRFSISKIIRIILTRHREEHQEHSHGTITSSWHECEGCSRNPYQGREKSRLL